MSSLMDGLFYIFIFLSVYIQVFFLITFLENRKRIEIRKNSVKLSDYPAVTIIVPCWNEEKTVMKTVQSLLNLNYPKDKVNIFLIDDGSTDNTFNEISKFSNKENIKIFKKENGGKHTALNLGLLHSSTPFVGCLDADSEVEKDALVRIMSYFEKDEKIMAVAPSVIATAPKNLIQTAQTAEYHMGVFTKKMLSFLDAIHVTPGPFTIFRKKVFDDLGPYRRAHNTEDMEIAYRMQRYDYKIDHCNDAYVFTNTPSSIKKLYKQRLRWLYGFINNTLDYKDVIFRRRYGNFALFTLPTGIVSIFAVSFLFGKLIFSFLDLLYSKINTFQTIGFAMFQGTYSFDLFSINTNALLFLALFIYILVLFAIIFGRKMVEGKLVFSLSIFYYLILFRILSPFWLLNALFNTFISRKPSWR